jgi:hypothetical protein
MAELVQFDKALIGDEAYTWQMAEGDKFGNDYTFETAGDPQAIWGTERAVVRKRWRLVEVVTIPAKETEDDDV